MDARRVRIAFWPHTADPGVASTRIRCLQVIDGLRREGIDAALSDGSGAAPDLLVLAKRYDADSLQTALAWRERAGTRLVLDLCDNHFYYKQDAGAFWVERAQQLRAAVRAVDHVVAASDVLADVVRAECAGAAVTTIADALDDGAPQRRARWSERRAVWGLRLFLLRHRVEPGRRLLWFGNHGSPYADGGMQDIGRIADALARHHRAAPLTLTVVSNSREAFDRLRVGWPVPTHYVPWSSPAFNAALRASDIALIPAQRNPFTLCKTNNRLATAFSSGLAVAADGLPAYEEFADLAVLDDWDAGLGRLMRDAAQRQRCVAAARERLQQRYSLALTCHRWIQLFDRLLVEPVGSRSAAPGKEIA
jgi:hypothetical protein